MPLPDIAQDMMINQEVDRLISTLTKPKPTIPQEIMDIINIFSVPEASGQQVPFMGMGITPGLPPTLPITGILPPIENITPIIEQPKPELPQTGVFPKLQLEGTPDRPPSPLGLLNPPLTEAPTIKASKGGAEIVQPGKISRRPEELSLEEINQQIEEGNKSDREIAVELFGKETAKRYESLQRIANSSTRSPDDLDKASKEIGELEDSLTEAEQNKLFGIGEDIIDVDLLKGLRDSIEFSRLNDESAEQLGKSLRFSVTRIGDKTDPSEMNSTELAAFVGIKEAFKIAQEKNFDLQKISNSALRASAERFSDPADAEFMLKRFLNVMKKIQ